jgi:hypothetical protein
MKGPRDEERLYTAMVLAFLSGLVALGLVGVPALLVAAIGVAVAALAIAVFRRPLEARRRGTSGSTGGHQPVPAKYVPQVLESGSLRRRRGIRPRRHRGASPPLRFR